MPTLTFDDYIASAPHASPQWATSDRGWLYRGEDCLGFYLAYDAIPGYREAFVLAVAYDRAHHQTWRRDTHCASVADAKHWLLAQHEEN